MRQLRTSHWRNARYARILVLAALLCAVAVPMVEASHLHGLGDGNAECLLCKSTSLAPGVAAAAAIRFESHHTVAAAQPVPALQPRQYPPHQSRGPPRYT